MDGISSLYKKSSSSVNTHALINKPTTTFTMFSISTLLLSALALSTVHAIPARTPKWYSLAPITRAPRQEQSTLFIPPSTIAILGGVVPDNSSGLFPPFATTTMMQFYSIPDNKWSSRAPVPVAMNHINAAVVDGKIYLLGGLVEHNSTPGRSWQAPAVSDSYMYDPDTDVWTKLAHSLPDGEERGSAAMGVFEKKIFLAGGMFDLQLYGNSSQNTVSVVSIFDTETQNWMEVPPAAKYLPAPRDHAGAAVVGNKMYVLGGRNHGMYRMRGNVYILDLCDLEAGWTTSAAQMPTPRGGVAAGVVGTKIYTFGGEGDESVESGVFNEVEAYDVVTDSWESAGTMKVPRHGTYAASVDGRIYIPGGGILEGGEPVSDFDVFVP
jgi:N-acetylneuraminic acid mutarotase